MDKELVSEFCFDDYKIERIDFNINPSFSHEQVALDIGFAFEIAAHKELPEGKVTLTAHIFENAIEKNYPFELIVSISGYFHMTGDVPKETMWKYIEVSGTTALFPFLRSAIADITKTANVEPLLLPLINVHRVLEEHKRKTLVDQKKLSDQ